MPSLIVGVAGGSGSGKSTVARKVAEQLTDISVASVSMDAYYRNMTHLTFDERKQLNWDHPDVVDMELLGDQLEVLAGGAAIEKPVYDFVTHLRSTRTETVSGADVVIVDGILLYWDSRVRALCDMKIFVDVEADIRLIRRIGRDMRVRGRQLKDILDQYMSTVRPMHEEFVEPTKQYADIIVPHGGQNVVAIEMIAARIQERLRPVEA
ncbi:MAG TPA: uridine kinase [Gemmatimonadaceae bacterium]|nr:uridine kinase [Gemmatimonadaceae bacterium]